MSAISPDHYKGKIEAIEAILEAVKDLPGGEGFIAGNVLKYVWRYNRKGGLDDLRKAENYLNRLKVVYEERISGGSGHTQHIKPVRDSQADRDSGKVGKKTKTSKLRTDRKRGSSVRSKKGGGQKH